MPGKSEPAPQTSCAVCLGTFGPSCVQSRHSCREHTGSVCQACMRRWVASQGPLPHCPLCPRELSRRDLVKFGADLEAWELAARDRAIQALPGLKMVCPNSACGQTFEFEDRVGLVALACPYCQHRFCSQCRQQPHYRVDCAEVQALRLRYLEWVRLSRGAQAQAAGALEEEQARFEELRRDEEYKAEHCRVCPHCRRVVERLEGCSAMRCGYDTDTKGNQQDGCGKAFNWERAARYKAQGPAPPKAAALPRRPRRPMRHEGWLCDLCHRELLGLRFRCVHCPEWDCCVDCEPRAAEHGRGHVLEIMGGEDAPRAAKCAAAAARAASAGARAVKVRLRSAAASAAREAAAAAARAAGAADVRVVTTGIEVTEEEVAEEAPAVVATEVAAVPAPAGAAEAEEAPVVVEATEVAAAPAPVGAAQEAPAARVAAASAVVVAEAVRVAAREAEEARAARAAAAAEARAAAKARAAAAAVVAVDEVMEEATPYCGAWPW